MKILIFSVFLINYSLSSRPFKRQTKIDWSSEDVVLPESPPTFLERKTLSNGFQGSIDYPPDSISILAKTKSFTFTNSSLLPDRKYSIPIIRRAKPKDIRLSQEDIVGVGKEEFPGTPILIKATEDPSTYKEQDIKSLRLDRNYTYYTRLNFWSKKDNNNDDYYYGKALKEIENEMDTRMKLVPRWLSRLLYQHLNSGVNWENEGRELTGKFTGFIHDMIDVQMIDNLEAIFFFGLARFELIFNRTAKRQIKYPDVVAPMSREMYESLIGGNMLCYWLWPFCQFVKFKQELAKKIEIEDLNILKYFWPKLVEDEEEKYQGPYMQVATEKLITLLSNLKVCHPETAPIIQKYLNFQFKFARFLYDAAVEQEKIFFAKPIEKNPKPINPSAVQLNRNLNIGIFREGYRYLKRRLQSHFGIQDYPEFEELL
jgi:hypothetical protein